MAYRLFRYILPVALLILVQACDGNDPSVNASRLRIKLTDAASPIMRELHVDIREISVFLVDTATHEGEWHTLDFSGRSYDILKYMNGKTVQLVDQYVPAGTELQQIRLLFGDNNQVVMLTDTTKESRPLRIPAELEQGLEIDAIKMEMRLNTISSMIVDLNASLSVWRIGNEYYLYPVARAFPETYGGKLKGQVSPLLEANPQIFIVQDTDTLITIPEREAGVNSNVGMFQFIGLKEGEWEVHVLTHPESAYRDSVFVSTIESGKTTDVRSIQLKVATEE